MFETLPEASRRALIERLGILRPELKRGRGLVGAEEAGGNAGLIRAEGRTTGGF